jgi:hypothetical protein
VHHSGSACRSTRVTEHIPRPRGENVLRKFHERDRSGRLPLMKLFREGPHTACNLVVVGVGGGEYGSMVVCVRWRRGEEGAYVPAVHKHGRTQCPLRPTHQCWGSNGPSTHTPPALDAGHPPLYAARYGWGLLRRVSPLFQLPR